MSDLAGFWHFNPQPDSEDDSQDDLDLEVCIDEWTENHPGFNVAVSRCVRFNLSLLFQLEWERSDIHPRKN